MPRPGWIRALSLGAIVVAACDRSDRAAVTDTAQVAQPVAAPASRPSRGDWSPELGDLLVVPSDSEALVVYPDHPDATLVASAPFALLGAAGDTIAARVMLTIDDTLQCGDAPVAHLAPGTPGGWSAGFRGGSVVPVRADSIESFAPRDSAQTVADLARLASAVTAQSRSRFTGLPFAVLEARRFRVEGVQVLAAHLVRRLPQEAAPLEEHVLIIAERGRADTAWVTRFSQQSQGSEETAEYFDVVAVARAGDSTLLILARDASARTEYQLLRRSPSGEWRVRWTRPVSC